MATTNASHGNPAALNGVRQSSESVTYSDTTVPNGETTVPDAEKRRSADFSPHHERPGSPSSKVEADQLENGRGPPAVEPVDPEVEKRIMRKLDKRIVPMVMWVYLMNMMDRGM